MAKDNMGRHLYEIAGNDFLRGYIVSALWSTPFKDTDGEDKHLDDKYGPEDLNDVTFEKAKADCAEFKEKVGETLNAAYALKPDYHESEAGHHFWLTRCGHGAGFWDNNNYGDAFERLSTVAQSFGSVDWEVTDDGKINQIGV